MRHILGKDLNLLTVFAALWRERNVTKAARAIGMTQPSLSRALSRLRNEFADPLFVRVAKGVAPTERAKQLSEDIIASLEMIERAYISGSKFDPRSLQRIFNIVTADYFEVVAGAAIVPRLMQEAPGLTLNFRTGAGIIPKGELERGEIDLVVLGIYEHLPEGFFHQKILSDRYRSVVRTDHPQVPITPDKFANIPHVLVTPKGNLSGIVDVALGKLGKARRVAIGSPNFLSAVWMVAHTDFVMSAPKLLIEQLKAFFPLTDFSTPVAIPNLELFQIWHARTNHDPAHRWLRQQISEYCKDITKR